MAKKDELFDAVMRQFKDNDIRNQAELDDLTKDCSDFPYDLIYTIMGVISSELS